MDDSGAPSPSPSSQPPNRPAPSGRPASSDGPTAGPAVGPTAGEALAQALLEPLAALALREGIQLPALIDGLKIALVREAVRATPPGRDAAARTSGASGSAVTDSGIAVMTGVHRKDVRRIRTSAAPTAARGASVAMQVFARWRSDPRYLTARGAPRQLARQPRADDPLAPSFESLAQAVTRDVHPRTVLGELMRLGIVESRPGDRLRLARSAFVPVGDDRQMASLAVSNLADHASAIVANLAASGPRYLEQAIFSDGFSAESARVFNQRSLQAWQQVFDTMMPLARALFDADRRSGVERSHRVRLGMYSWVGEPGPDIDRAAPARRRRDADGAGR
ncbi:MAG: DUF6502 family protein [Lautropia sp.]